MKRLSPREEAVKTVIKVIKDNAFSNIVLSKSFDNNESDKRDRALYAAIVRTVLERKLTLDHIISLFVKKAPDISMCAVLYTGIAQVLYMDKIPDNAACDETVKLAGKLEGTYCKGFVNGVMRNICRNKKSVLEQISQASDSVKYSLHPSVCQMIRSQYQDNADEIMESMFSRPKTPVRVNTLKVTSQELQSEFTSYGIEFTANNNKITIESNLDKAVSLIDEGRFFIQGENSQYAVELLDARPNMTTVDVCACPGGKTLGAAIDMENKGEIFAFDLHANKLSLIEKSAFLLGIDIIQTKENDSRFTVENLRGKADRVICDVPCSSVGVIASKPEIRYKDISNLNGLYKTQREILQSSSLYLKKGGMMVYSTCTINQNENQLAVDEFIKSNPCFELVGQTQFLIANGCYDGFYAALIRRKDSK